MTLVDIDGANPGHAGDVPPGSKHLVATGEQDAAHLRVFGQGDEVRRKQCLQFKAQGIGSLRPVQAQQGHAWQRVFEQYRQSGGIGHGHPRAHVSLAASVLA
ncbi:hypothetical protein D3C78_1396990 [compost metagenome]